jgi:zinc protease
MNRSIQRAFVSTGVACLALASAARAQQAPTLDRSKQPVVGPAPTFKVPAWSVDTLSNGVRLVVVEKHDLPIVSLSVHFEGGTDQLGTRVGVAGFVGNMLREGTATRSADQLNNELALLGTSVNFGVGNESGSAGFSSLSRTFDQTLAIMMDMMLHSTFPAASLERLRTQSLSAYLRSQDAVGTIAAQITPKLLYGDQPYGRVVSDVDLRSVTRDDVATLAKQFFVTANATAYVVGDMTRAQARAKLEQAFKVWPKSGAKLAVTYPVAPTLGPSTIYLVDMPNKPQSQLVLARTVAPEYSPDMAQADVMNAILGGMFQSRLNANIREAHGYSYGFGSGIGWRSGPGSLRAQGAVTREKTDSSLIEAMKEIRGMTGSTPVTADELTAARNSLTLSLPSRVQSIDGISSVVSRIVDDNLPKDWWSKYIAAVNTTTAADVAAMTKKYMDPEHLAIVIVGDGAKIEAAVKATNIAPVVKLDKAGKKLP